MTLTIGDVYKHTAGLTVHAGLMQCVEPMADLLHRLRELHPDTIYVSGQESVTLLSSALAASGRMFRARSHTSPSTFVARYGAKLGYHGVSPVPYNVRDCELVLEVDQADVDTPSEIEASTKLPTSIACLIAGMC